MTKTSEFRTKPSKPLISGAAKAVFLPASHTEVPLNRGGLPVTAALELDLNPAWDARCLWCSRTFTPRATGGSAQRFCCTGHRQQFWIAARRWTIRQSRRAYILSVDCLKAPRASVHAAREKAGRSSVFNPLCGTIEEARSTALNKTSQDSSFGVTLTPHRPKEP
jgi:hypothetical protein